MTIYYKYLFLDIWTSIITNTENGTILIFIYLLFKHYILIYELIIELRATFEFYKLYLLR